MTDEETLEAIAATEIERLAYLGRLGDFGTTGPAPDDHPPVPGADKFTLAPHWDAGWWVGARRVPAHPHRVGPPIDPCVIVDHTTDMHRQDWNTLVRRWEFEPGDGACAQILVGPTEAHGTIQWMPICRNGNHVGGKEPPNGHGLLGASGRWWHPNLLAVGIEFMCAGGQLRRIDGAWRFVEDGRIHGDAIPDADVDPDPQRPGRGWERLTPYQSWVRERLHADLELVLRPMPTGLVAVSTGEAVPSWGIAKSTRRLGHVSLDPTNRSDPWPNNMRAIGVGS